ncbi:MAG: hypothetical protein LAO77_18370 [Acidobacteriia bacterium]|nr:hypothetical protein [Terriglobia bacterium]
MNTTTPTTRTLFRSFSIAVLLASALILRGHIVGAWQPPANCYDFVTGGGWFTPTQSGTDQANFGFNAGYKNGAPPPPLMGELNYIDHNTGMHVHSTSVDDYNASSCFDAVHDVECADRSFSGTAEVNGVGGYSYIVEVVDDGEPGNVPKGHDRFIITVGGPGLSYHSDSGGAPDAFTPPSDGIDGGNIQIHKSCTANPK